MRMGADKYLVQAGRILCYSTAQGSSPQSTNQREIPATDARMRMRNICRGRRVSRKSFATDTSPMVHPS